MGFILGFLLGVIATLAGLGFLAYWLCSRSNNVAVARFVNGIAQALASIKVKQQQSVAARKEEEPAAPRKEEEPAEEANSMRRSRLRRDAT